MDNEHRQAVRKRILTFDLIVEGEPVSTNQMSINGWKTEDIESELRRLVDEGVLERFLDHKGRERWQKKKIQWLRMPWGCLPSEHSIEMASLGGSH